MVKEIKYNSNLSLEEVTKIYWDVRSEFEIIRTKYSGLLRILKKKMNRDHVKQLWDYCTEVLLPLSTNPPLKSDIVQYVLPAYSKSIQIKIIQLQFQIIKYLSHFKNGGVTLLNKRCD